jgi:hypothetical protein
MGIALGMLTKSIPMKDLIDARFLPPEITPAPINPKLIP